MLTSGWIIVIHVFKASCFPHFQPLCYANMNTSSVHELSIIMKLHVWQEKSMNSYRHAAVSITSVELISCLQVPPFPPSSLNAATGTRRSRKCPHHLTGSLPPAPGHDGNNYRVSGGMWCGGPAALLIWCGGSRQAVNASHQPLHSSGSCVEPTWQLWRFDVKHLLEQSTSCCLITRISVCPNRILDPPENNLRWKTCRCSEPTLSLRAKVHFLVKM